MSTVKIILILIVVLVINNVALLYWLGHFDEDSTVAHQLDEVTASPGGQPGGKVALSRQPALATQQSGGDEHAIPATESDQIALDSPAQETVHDQNFMHSLRRVVETDDFLELMNVWQMRASKLHQENDQRFSAMDADELFAVVENPKGPLDVQTAMQYLAQGKMSKLSVYQLKTLYQDADADQWSKAKLLIALLEQRDAQGLEWAKQLLRKPGTRFYSDNELLVHLYEQDPDFVRQFVDQLDLSSTGNRAASALSFISNEPELITEFLTKNFDKLLDSDNEQVFHVNLRSNEFKPSAQQQSKLLAFFDSGNRTKRSFAINHVSIIEDVNELRQAYAKLSRMQEKRQFVWALWRNKQSAQHRELGREIADSSGEPQLQSIIR